MQNHRRCNHYQGLKGECLYSLPLLSTSSPSIQTMEGVWKSFLLFYDYFLFYVENFFQWKRHLRRQKTGDIICYSRGQCCTCVEAVMMLWTFRTSFFHCVSRFCAILPKGEDKHTSKKYCFSKTFWSWLRKSQLKDLPCSDRQSMLYVCIECFQKTWDRIPKEMGNVQSADCSICGPWLSFNTDAPQK